MTDQILRSLAIVENSRSCRSLECSSANSWMTVENDLAGCSSIFRWTSVTLIESEADLALVQSAYLPERWLPQWHPHVER